MGDGRSCFADYKQKPSNRRDPHVCLMRHGMGAGVFFFCCLASWSGHLRVPELPRCLGLALGASLSATYSVSRGLPSLFCCSLSSSPRLDGGLPPKTELNNQPSTSGWRRFRLSLWQIPRCSVSCYLSRYPCVLSCCTSFFLQLDALMAEAPKELVSCSSVEVVSEGGTIDGTADLCLHPVEVSM